MTTTDERTSSFTLNWTLDAAPADVFRAWTDPDGLEWYYNPAQPIPDEPIELDLRVGGEWRQLMVIDEETSFYTGGLYLEIVPNERLVFAWGATDGWPKLDLASPENSPRVTLSLNAVGESTTELALHVELPETMPNDGVPGWWSMVEHGWRDTVDRLASALERTSPTA